MPYLPLLGQDAVAQTGFQKATEKLALLDVRGPFKLLAVMPLTRSTWRAEIRAEGGGSYTAYFKNHDQLTSLVRAGNWTSGVHRPPTQADIALSRRWLGRFKPAFPTHLLPLSTKPLGVRYESIVAGYPFASMAYGYDVVVADGKLAMFAIFDAPPVGLNRPKFDKTEAVNRARPLFGRLNVAYEKIEARRLAWLEVEAAPQAVLVWQVIGHPKPAGIEATKTWADREIDIDARTGELRLPKRP